MGSVYDGFIAELTAEIKQGLAELAAELNQYYYVSFPLASHLQNEVRMRQLQKVLQGKRCQCAISAPHWRARSRTQPRQTR